MKPTRPKEVETVYWDTEDAEERIARATEILAEGIYAYLREQGLLGNQAGQQQEEETASLDKE